jgi:hypothetical protein
MTPNSEQKKLIDDALWGHNFTMEQINNGEYLTDDRISTIAFDDERELKGGFASMSICNLLEPLSALHKKAETDGLVTLENGVTLKISKLTERKSIYPTAYEPLLSLDIYLNEENESTPSYRIKYEVNASKPGSMDYLANLYRLDPNKPDDEYPTILGQGSFIEVTKKKDEVRLLFRDAGRSVVYSEFAAVMNLLRPALRGYDLRSENTNIGLLKNFDSVDVLNADGGLPGPLSAYTLEHMQKAVARKILPLLANKSDKVYKALNDRDMTWGKKLLRYNDHDDHVFIIPTLTPLQRAYYHENVALCSNYSAHIIMTSINDDGLNTDIKIYAIDRGRDFLPDIVQSIENDDGEFSPMIHFDLATNSMAYFSDECPDLLDMAVFGNNCDLDIIDEGEVDNQANHSTDFDRYFGKYDDDFDEDDEQDDILAPAIR